MGIDTITRQAVFLDRDGVINRAIMREDKPYPPANLSQLEILPGVPEALACLRAAGFLLIVVTNQPDVARGTLPREFVDSINWTLKKRLPLDDIRVCYHDEPDGCACRKPQPGLILEAARDWKTDLGRSFVVGDRWKDIEAGRRAGCRTVLIDHGYRDSAGSTPDHRATSLLEAARWILSFSNGASPCRSRKTFNEETT
jgi:D-glycero-D-manno-heptose 1,7-bisphosphate phosphatase